MAISLKRPYVIVGSAMSIDGRIATYTGDSALSSSQDLDRHHKLRSMVDAIIVGKTTVFVDDPMLTVRPAKGGKNPIRIILDSCGIIHTNTKILQTSHKIPTIIVSSERISRADIMRIKAQQAEVLVAGKNGVDLNMLLNMLWQRGIRTVLVEGGGMINWEFVRLDLFDEMIITLSPFLIGGGQREKSSTSACSTSLLDGGQGFAELADSPNLSLKSVKRLKDHVVLHYVKV